MLLDLARHGHIELVISPFILQETEKVLREKFRWEERILKETLSRLKEIAKMARLPRQIIGWVFHKSGKTEVVFSISTDSLLFSPSNPPLKPLEVPQLFTEKRDQWSTA